MKLSGSLFTIISRTGTDCAPRFGIRLDAEHFIYKAHFPGEPITPGVCILQIVSELASEACGKPLEISQVRNVKFLQIISPLEHPEIDCSFTRLEEEDGLEKVQATLSKGEILFAKLSLVCRIPKA
ncbi:MAG: hypothetical protein MJY62_01495 [Bacteroidales bacterium]|nr:hypothetical protein [Bacteroidales bacterium]